MFYSLIIPVYNRPEEIDELLQSLALQTYRDFEVLVIEDGSFDDSEHIVNKYNEHLQLSYFRKSNTGPGDTRNFGAFKSKGDYLIFLDSDCIVPPDYLTEVEKELKNHLCDAFGGPDRADDSFTPIQKAINYAMTSFFTTGGIRGGKKKLDKFYPRSFNMGVKTDVFEELNGFSNMRFGEDIDLSIRLFKQSRTVRLFREAFVYHKRRTDFRKFYKQVYNSGMARIHLWKKYPDSLKLVHFLPALFTIFVLFSLIGAFFCMYSLLPLFLFALVVFVDASLQNKSIFIGCLSIIASFVQLIGYGTGFLHAFIYQLINKKVQTSAFNQTFYN